MLRVPKPSGTAPIPKSSLTARDVLLGRGTQYVDHAGNVQFRSLIREHVVAYSQATRRGEKGRIAEILHRRIKENGGRFLRKIISWREAEQYGLQRKHANDQSYWLPIGDSESLEKVKQAFRDETNRMAKNKPTDTQETSLPVTTTLDKTARDSAPGTRRSNDDSSEQTDKKVGKQGGKLPSASHLPTRDDSSLLCRHPDLKSPRMDGDTKYPLHAAARTAASQIPDSFSSSVSLVDAVAEKQKHHQYHHRYIQLSQYSAVGKPTEAASLAMQSELDFRQAQNRALQLQLQQDRESTEKYFACTSWQGGESCSRGDVKFATSLAHLDSSLIVGNMVDAAAATESVDPSVFHPEGLGSSNYFEGQQRPAPAHDGDVGVVLTGATAPMSVDETQRAAASAPTVSSRGDPPRRRTANTATAQGSRSCSSSEEQASEELDAASRTATDVSFVQKPKRQRKDDSSTGS